MKKILLTALLSIAALSCQTEETVVNNAPQDNLINNTALTGKLLRMAQYPTAIDNVIDGTGCFSIQFPFTVVANGQTITIDATNDYQTIRNILAEDDSDNDVVTIQFPVNITYADYTQAVLANQAQFNNVVSNCIQSIELSCIDLDFPIGLNTYNSQNQLAEAFDIANEESLFEFLTTLSLYDAVTLDYPINFQTPGGSTINIQDNSQLESAINSYTDECLAALNPGPDPDLIFEEIIVQGTWYVSYFFRDEEQTEDYAGYDFDFDSGGIILVTGGDNLIHGNWTTFQEDELEIDMAYNTTAFDELSEDWTVVEFTETLIKLQKVSGGGDDIRWLHFTRN